MMGLGGADRDYFINLYLSEKAGTSTIHLCR